MRALFLRKSSLFSRLLTLSATAGALLTAASPSAVQITESTYEGRSQFVIRTQTAEYWLDRQGGGLSRLIDPEGKDWISFHKEPLSAFPQSAAAGYRGIPNSVYGKENPDAGVGHPGFDLCESNIIGTNKIRTASKSGRWAWTWYFNERSAEIHFEKVDPQHAYWFLYEGTPGGEYSPKNQFWGTDQGGLNSDAPAIRSQRFGKWRWVYFGHRETPRVLAIIQKEPDTLDDTFWYLGASNGGDVDSSDGMVVFGFGRGQGKPLLRDPRRFIISLIEIGKADAQSHGKIASAIEKINRATTPIQP